MVCPKCIKADEDDIAVFARGGNLRLILAPGNEEGHDKDDNDYLFIFFHSITIPLLIGMMKMATNIPTTMATNAVMEDQKDPMMTPPVPGSI